MLFRSVFIVSDPILSLAPPHRLKHFADALCALGRRQQVNVIGHPNIGMNRQTVRSGGLNQRVAKKLVVGIGTEHHLSIVTALDDVLRLTGDDDTRKAGHGDGLCNRFKGTKE